MILGFAGEKVSLWPAIAFLIAAGLIGLNAVHLSHHTKTTFDEKREAAKWTVAFFVIATIAVVCFFLTLNYNKLWPFA